MRPVFWKTKPCWGQGVQILFCSGSGHVQANRIAVIIYKEAAGKVDALYDEREELVPVLSRFTRLLGASSSFFRQQGLLYENLLSVDNIDALSRYAVEAAAAEVVNAVPLFRLVGFCRADT